jgi:hypothetical protein
MSALISWGPESRISAPPFCRLSAWFQGGRRGLFLIGQRERTSSLQRSRELSEVIAP